MNQPAESTSTPPANAFARMNERERRTDEALEAASTIATFTREIDARAEQTVELLTSIDSSLRRLVELAEKGGRT